MNFPIAPFTLDGSSNRSMPPSNGPAQRNILDLDKSDAPFSILIDQACELLHIQLDGDNITLLHDNKEVETQPSLEHENNWTLRWLLKNLQATEVRAGSVCLDYKAWLLLRELLLRTPLRALAGLLRGHKFIATVRATLQWLKQKSASFDGSNYPLDPTASPHPDLADSSPSTVGASPTNVPQASRKRKRDANSGTHVPQNIKDIARLYTSICCNLIYLQDIAGDRSRSYDVEHLLAALRGTPEEAATILGSSLPIVDFLIRHEEGNSATETSSTGTSAMDISTTTHDDAWIWPVVQYWQSQTTRLDGNIDMPICTAFSKSCLLAILHHIQTIANCKMAGDYAHDILNILDNLLRNHVLLPAQKSHLNSLQPRDIRNSDIPQGLIQNLLTPLTQAFQLEELARGRAYEAATYLFAIAARESRQLTSVKGRDRDTWLQYLFDHIAQSAGMFDEYDPDNTLSWMLVSFTQMMLATAAQSQVPLESATLKRLLQPLFRGSWVFTEVEWGIVSFCMELDASIFFEPPGKSDSNGVPPQFLSNKLLMSLLSRMCEVGWRFTPVDNKRKSRSFNDVLYNSFIPTILAPLANSFIKARNASGFFKLWKTQLSQHSMSARNADKISIWEDDELLHTIGKLCEHALSFEVADQILRQAFEALESPVDLPDGPDERFARLVTLECLLLGITSDRSLEKLEQRAVELYRLVLRLSAEPKSRSNKLDARYWRILALINDKWSLPQQSSDDEQAALRKAFAAIEEVCKVEVPRHDYSQEFQAFRFILSLAEAEKTRCDALLAANPQADFTSKIGVIIENVLEYSHDQRKINPASYSHVEWSPDDDSVVTGADFGLACCAQLLAVPRTLSKLDKAVQFHVFDDLYTAAFSELEGIVSERRASSQLSDALIEYFITEENNHRSCASYLKIWEMLSRSTMLDDQAAVSACFRDLQVSKFLRITSPGAEFEIDGQNASVHLLVMTPLHLFTKTQKINLSNRLLQLLADGSLDSNSVTKALHLLIFFTQTPSKSMVLLDKPNLVIDSDATDTRVISTTWLFVIAAWLDGSMVASGVKVTAIKQLKQLNITVLKYLCFVSTRSFRVSYLGVIANQLTRVLSARLGREHVATLTLIENCLSFFVRNLKNLPLQNCPVDWQHLVDVWRESNFLNLSALRESCTTSTTDVHERKISILILEALESHNATTLISPLTNKHDLTIPVFPNELIEMPRKPVWNAGDYGNGKHRIQLFVCGQHWRDSRQIVQEALGVLRSQIPEEKKYLLHKFQSIATQRNLCEMLSELNEVLIDTKAELDDPGLTWTSPPESSLGPREYSVLLLLERMLIGLDASQRPSEILASRLAQIFAKLCESLYRPTDSQSCVQALRCVSLLLRYQKSAISQYHTDGIVTAFAVKARMLGNESDKYETGCIFTALCRIFETTLIMHRKKLGGRYHLIVPALEWLLQCLFLKYKDLDKSVYTLEEEMAYAGYGEAQATAYARLLTTICDPTVSAVSRSRRTPRQELNDETQKARNIAGQYMQYVVEEFCSCQLDGRLLPEMRVALNAGLWAIFRVMPQGVMRNLNASMDPSSRSVFKSLYDEYRRSGTWKSGDASR